MAKTPSGSFPFSVCGPRCRIDALLLAAFLAILGSGVAVSRAVLPQLGLQGDGSLIWMTVHKFSSTGTLVLLAVKLVLHRRWLANAFKRLLSPGSVQVRDSLRTLAGRTRAFEQSPGSE